MQAYKAEAAKRQAKQLAQSKAAGVRGKLKSDQARTAAAYGPNNVVTASSLQDAMGRGASTKTQSAPSGRPVSAMRGSSLSHAGAPRADIGTRIPLADGMQRRWRRGK